MRNLLQNKTARVILLLLALSGLTALAGSHLNASPHRLARIGAGSGAMDIETPSPTPYEAESEAPAANGTETPTPRPANAYVVVTAGGESRIFPLPDKGEAQYKIVLRQPDGRDTSNVISLTPESMTMHSSTCDNQLCVEQGEVTLSNRGHRALGNQIICLPNHVLMELYTPEELLEAVKGQPAP